MSSSLRRTAYATCMIIKPERDVDWYVARTLWHTDAWIGTRAEAEKDGIDVQRLDRADATGTSSRTGAFGWDDR